MVHDITTLLKSSYILFLYNQNKTMFDQAQQGCFITLLLSRFMCALAQNDMAVVPASFIWMQYIVVSL